MKTKLYISAIICFLFSMNIFASGLPGVNRYSNLPPVVLQQVALDGNNINAWIINSGIIDQNLMTTNTPGFEWPKYSGQFAIFTAGLTIAAMVNGNLRMAAASYKGEYAPGYVIDSSGIPVPQTNSNFRIWKVVKGQNTSYDWLNWGLMVPYGAPFVDVNHNGIYEPAVDTPGISSASQTIFVCLTDGFTSSHTIGEGFGGGTAPLYAELHMTAWCYSNTGYEDMQFLRWNVINKSHLAWNSAYFAIISDPDLGCANDDYIGCDTTRSLGYCYNGEDVDCAGSYRYPGITPAVGIKWLSTSLQANLKMTSFVNFTNTSTQAPPCEHDPNGEDTGAYNMMKGLKKDATPFVIPPGGSASLVTKYVYPGDPETGTGWTEGVPGSPTGSVWNCGGPGHYTGDLHSPNVYGDRRFVMSSGSDSYTVNPGDTNKIYAVQLIAQGTSRLNSVTRLKQLADFAQAFYTGGFMSRKLSPQAVTLELESSVKTARQMVSSRLPA